jgi:hypothetical protein
MAKSQEIFTLPNLCHIAIEVEPYRSQHILMLCCNRQKFRHVWANCKQPPARELSRDREPLLNIDMLQLQADRRRDKLQGLQAHERRDAEEEDPANSKD